MVICEFSNNPTFCTLANKSEFVYYETVYAISEVLKDTVTNKAKDSTEGKKSQTLFDFFMLMYSHNS